MADSKLKVETPCPNSPNCVSTFSENEQHAIAPLKFFDDPIQARDRLKEVLDGIRGAKLILESEWELSYTFTSLIFRFTDDGLFQFDPENKVVHFRSSSRVGYSDLGANRRRMEKIREQFER